MTTTKRSTCVHFWKIETPNGETCHGVCRLCGAEHDFPSEYDDAKRAGVRGRGLSATGNDRTFVADVSSNWSSWDGMNC